MTDQLNKYLFADQLTRAQTVELQQTWQTGLEHQHYPESVRNLLGELAAAAVLLAGNLKLDGSLVLQAQGDGPIALMVVECTSQFEIRATATLREDAVIPEDATLQTLLNTYDNGRFIVVLEPKPGTDMQPYQGIVPLQGDNLAEVLENYMKHSEQLDTKIFLAADAHKANGLLLQRLPGTGGSIEGTEAPEEPSWERAQQLAQTIKNEELLELPAAELIHRLFWQEDLLQLEPTALQWHCPCTRERVADMLQMLGREEIESILTEQEYIEVACNFCGKPYQFDAVDSAQLFIAKSDQPESKKTLH
ncbi:Hsp33 family molecular chaperone HslO [Paenalcaligenes hominis]|uniref:Hsp33 family molecular chaperone HslO n=1 Tax=Paenalcaligenes hominis TaxID=643674 RepID=UPI0035254FA1